MRIRTVKPEFWTDEVIGELSIPARLLFIALLNYADDEGNFKVSVKQIKIHTFPYDDIDISPLFIELIDSKLLQPYCVDGHSYCNITNFKKHQKINRPSPPIHPLFTEYSVSNHILFTDNSRGKEGRKESIGVEKERNNNNNKNLSFEDIQKLFKEQNCAGAEEFYAKMTALHWLNSDGKPILNQTSYVLTTIDRIKANERTTKQSNNDNKPSIKQLTGAEIRRIARQNKQID